MIVAASRRDPPGSGSGLGFWYRDHQHPEHGGAAGESQQLEDAAASGRRSEGEDEHHRGARRRERHEDQHSCVGSQPEADHSHGRDHGQPDLPARPRVDHEDRRRVEREDDGNGLERGHAGSRGHERGVLQEERVQEQEGADRDQSDPRDARSVARHRARRHDREDHRSQGERDRHDPWQHPLLPHGIPTVEDASDREVEGEAEQKALYRPGCSSGEAGRDDRHERPERSGGRDRHEPERDRSRHLESDPAHRQQADAQEDGAPIADHFAERRTEDRPERGDTDRHRRGSRIPHVLETVEDDREEHPKDLERDDAHHRKKRDSHRGTMEEPARDRHAESRPRAPRPALPQP